MLMLAAVVATVVVLSVPSVVTAHSVAMKVSIPFEFQVGNQTLPAGKYLVQKIGDSLRISDRAGHSANAITNAVSGKSTGDKTQLVFNQYGRRFFLSEARWEGYMAGRGLAKSKAEIELAKVMTAERVDLASNGR
jgi:hypothetical protein